jgi:hypothetical protein
MNLNHMTNQKMDLGKHDSSSLTRKDSRTKGAREEGRL